MTASNAADVKAMSYGASIEHPFSIHSASIRRRWETGKMQFAKVYKYVACLLLVLFVGVGNVWGVAYQANYGWESNALDGWAKNSATAVNVRNSGARTGKYCVDLEANGSSSSLKLSSVSFTKNFYHHVIVYVKTDSETATVQINLNGNNPGNIAPGTSWTRITHAYNYTSSTGNKNIEFKFPTATSSAHVHGYFDDVVFYTSTNETTDITAPTAATSASATTSEISWTCGSDANTGIQNTLIWKRTGGAANDLTLNNQGNYVVPAEGSTLDQSGHWTLVNASVADDATSYEGTFTPGDVYAIVHRDLAYNYSSPAYVTIPSGAPVVDVTPPTLSSSSPADEATSVALSGNIVLTFSENVSVLNASKFTLSGGAGSLTTASISASGAAVTIPYSGLANSTTYTLSTAAGAVEDAAHNENAALDDISFTTEAATHSVTHTLTNNITTKSGDTGAGAAAEGEDYDAVFKSGKVGYTLPSEISVTIGGADATVDVDYTWNSSTGAFQVPAAKVTGNIVVTIAGVAPVKTFKSDYSDFTQVGETNAYYTYLAQEAYTSYAVAGWTSYENESFGSKKLKIDPATDGEISGSNANYGCLRSDRIMEYYLTGVTAVKFYVINGGSSGDPRVAKYTLNGGEETTLVSVAASTSNTGTIELNPSTNNTIRISASSDLHMGAMKVTLPDASCAAGVPGNISKGEASGGTGTITLTAAGDIASGDTWYWQSAADGTATNLGSGKTKDVNAAGTYYIRSYNTVGECWSAAKSVTVDAADLLTAISPTLSYATSNIVVGNTSSPTLEGNTGSGSVSYALNDVSPAGSLTINESTGVVTAVTVGGTATVTASIAANGNYAAGVANSGTITVLANPLGTHTITYTLSPINTADAALTSTQVSTSAYLKNLTTIDASLCGFASSPSKGSNRTAKINRASTEKDSDKYVYLTFDVESGYQFTPSSIVVKVANVSNATTFDASLISSDGPSVGEEEKSFASTDGTVETWTITNEAETALTGTVTLKIWPYAASAGSFRFGTPITIVGTVAEYVAPCPATMPGNISKGTLSSGTLTLNAAGTPEIGDTWYWQTSESGTSTSNSGTSYGVTSAGTYYVRSYNATGECWSAAKSITVTAADFVETYTVVYKDGTTELGSETIEVGSHPTASGISTTKLLCTFASWQLSGSDVALNEVDGAADETVTLTARWTKTYAQTADLATEAAGDKTAIATFLANKGYSAKVGSGGAYDTNASGYLGYKFKNNKDTVQFYVQNGKIVDIAFMYIEANFKVYVDGVETYTVTNKTTSKTPLLKYVYANGADKFIVIQNNSADTKSAVINKIDIHNPFVVTYDATTNGGEAVDAATFTGAALTLPSATKSTENFLGWYTTASEGGSKIGDAGDSYTPTASITLYARFEAISTDARLASISFSSNAGTLSPTFNPEVVNYTYTMPYKTADVPTITGATSVHANAQDPEIVSQASAWGETAVIRGVAESGDKKTYNVTMQVAPKDGACLVWGDIPSNATMNHNASKSYYASSDITMATTVNGKDGSAPSGVKFQSNNYIHIGLNDGTFEAGDVVALSVTYESGVVMHVYKAQAAAEGDIIGTGTGTKTAVGLNKVAITEDAADIWLVRGGAYGSWNPHVDGVGVYRVTNPVLKSISINGCAGVIDEEHKTVSVTIPSDADLADLTIEKKILWNEPAATNSIVVNSGSAWTLGENTYVLTDKDDDATTYTITLTRDVAIESVTVSGETTVAAKSQITLTATVLPAEVSNKAVTWSSSDETKATVDANGVVTGKAAGSVTITATSVADGSKKGTKEITVTKFVGTERAYWFVYAADAEANGAENNSTVFGSAPTGSNNGGFELTLEEGWTVSTTKKTGSTSSFGTFTVPADFTATWYAAVKAGGNNRVLNMKQGDVVKYSVALTNATDPEIVKIENIAAGTYDIVLTGGSSISGAYLFAAELNSYPLTSVALEEGFNLRLEQSRTPVFTITPAKAAVASQEWSVVSRTGASDATLNTTTGEITAGTEEGTLTVKVTVTDAFGNVEESGNCVVKIVNIIDQKDVTGSMTWNWTGAGTANVTIDNEEALVLGNYINGDQWAYIKGTKNDYAYNTNNSGCYEALNGSSSLSFYTTVPGIVKITGRRRSNDAVVKINGEITVGTATSSVQTFAGICVAPGEVTITPDANGMRITKIEFDTDLDPTQAVESTLGGYERDVTQGYYGTICLPNGGIMTGAMLFELAYFDATPTQEKIFFDEILNGVMVAGTPYIFLPKEGVSQLGVYYTDAADSTAGHANGLYGSYTLAHLAADAGNYILYNNKYYFVDSDNVYVGANRAYIRLEEARTVTSPAHAPKPKAGCRRISMGAYGEEEATGIGNLQGDQVQNTKMLIDGQLFIICGDKMYDATGKQVK